MRDKEFYFVLGQIDKLFSLHFSLIAFRYSGRKCGAIQQLQSLPHYNHRVEGDHERPNC